MIVILKDEDLKRDDLRVVPIDHIELSDFSYFHEDGAVSIGKARTIVYFRDALCKLFKHGDSFPDSIFHNSQLTEFIQ